MADDTLLTAAGRIADGEHVDWASISSSLPSDEQRAIADELAVLGHIAAGHRQLHQLLPVSADTPPGQSPDRARWGHLDLLNIVGCGSYGTVYRAWDTRLERLVALKLFHGASDPAAVMQEGRMLARVRHENVVTVYGADVIDGVAGLWMELIHGETLEHLVKTRGPMTAVEAATVGARVAEALGAVHAAGLLHCDVKAQNVVQESGGRVVLMDLGAGQVVRETHEDDQLSDISGTPRYMAPELFQLGAASTKSTDIYSFGVLLYYLVSGRYPVDGNSLAALKQAHSEQRFIGLPDVRMGLPAAFLDIVARTTHRDPAQRPASAADVQATLAEIAAPAASKPRSIGWWAAVAAGVGLLAFVLARPLFTPAAPPAPEVRSIAVLPIKNLTGDPSKAYIADGLTEVLISNLARIRSLRVPSFAAVAPFRNGEEPPGETAKKLGVQMLLAGSVANVDEGVRIAVTLIDAATGQAVWGEELLREPSALLSAQTEIARLVAARLALKLSEEENAALTQRPLDPRAADAYLNGLASTAKGPTAYNDAVRFFRASVEIEPGFAQGWANLALAEIGLFDQSTGVNRAERARFIRGLAEHAIKLDPTLASGYAALGSTEFYFDWDFVAAEQSFRRALEVEPSNGFARQRFAMLLAALGRLDEAIAIGAEAEAIEPLVALRATSLGILYYYARDYENAIIKHQRSLVLAPELGTGHSGLGRVYLAQGRPDEAAREFQLAVEKNRYPPWLIELAHAYVAAGRSKEAAAVMAELSKLQQTGRSYSLDNLAYIAAVEGRFDDAFEILERAVDQKLTNVLWIAVDPRADPLRSDPRFDRLVARIGLRP